MHGLSSSLDGNDGTVPEAVAGKKRMYSTLLLLHFAPKWVNFYACLYLRQQATIFINMEATNTKIENLQITLISVVLWLRYRRIYFLKGNQIEGFNKEQILLRNQNDSSCK